MKVVNVKQTYEEWKADREKFWAEHHARWLGGEEDWWRPHSCYDDYVDDIEFSLGCSREEAIKEFEQLLHIEYENEGC